jgi:predicted alpha/beta-hydrolase family hydrolase
MPQIARWDREFAEPPMIRGFRHRPTAGPVAGIVLTHGAGGNYDSPLLVALCDVFAARGLTAVRCDLNYRQKRPKGPPSPSGAALDRQGLERAVEALRAEVDGPVFVGGSSYGGRQASILVSENVHAADGLLLLSYPLHPPGKPARLRTEHFGGINVPTLFAHGSKDAFGSVEEMNEALPLIEGPTHLEVFEGATHGIVQKRHDADKAGQIAERIAEEFLSLQAKSETL